MHEFSKVDRPSDGERIGCHFDNSPPSSIVTTLRLCRHNQDCLAKGAELEGRELWRCRDKSVGFYKA